MNEFISIGGISSKGFSLKEIIKQRGTEPQIMVQ